MTLGNFFFSSSGAAAYEIEQSLRFDGSSTLSRTNGTASTNKQVTVSFWAKRSSLSAYNTVLATGNWGGAEDDWLAFPVSDSIEYQRLGGGSGMSNTNNTNKFRDPSAWSHFVFQYDSTQSTANDRGKWFHNGEQLTTGNSGYAIDLNGNCGFVQNIQQKIGDSIRNTPRFFRGYLAEFHLIDGSIEDPTTFGEYDDNGVWRPIQVSGLTYGTNGYYLTFDPSATNGIGHDHSGNGNNFTASGFTTSGTGTDVMSDTPTTNYATMNPLRPSSYGSVSLSNGNLNASQNTTAYVSGAATIGVSSGKWYWEVDCNSVGFVTSIGITKDPTANGIINSGVYTYHYDGVKYVAGTATGYGASYTSGDLLGFALDLDAGTLVAYKNGTSQGTLQTGLSGTFFPYLTFYGTHNATFNFGQTAFQQTVPTGYSALNTSNLPAPDIADGSDYFNTVLYTGDGTSSRAITGMGFQADFLWLKPRSARNHSLVDVLRGTNHLQSNNTNAEASVPSFDSFDSDGFTVTADGSTNPNWNESPEPNVVWGWLAGNGTSSNTAGSITSTVSANPSAGFSIVSYSGSKTSAGSDTVGHGLGVAPSLIIVKRRNSAYGWSVAHASLGFGSSNILALDSTAAAGGYSWDDFGAAPTSSVFTVSYSNRTNISGGTHIAYCFAEVEGYSKFGSYTGNGSTDGPFVYCGFKPAWLLLKRTDSTSAWFMLDTKRDTYNVSDSYLVADDSIAEGTYTSVDFLSNGFKARNPSSSFNTSGATHIFAAFAENPFGGSGVSPATAR